MGPPANLMVTGGLLKNSRVPCLNFLIFNRPGPTSVFAIGFPALSSDRERGLTAGWYEEVHTRLVQDCRSSAACSGRRQVHPDTGPLQFPFLVAPSSRAA